MDTLWLYIKLLLLTPVLLLAICVVGLVIGGIGSIICSMLGYIIEKIDTICTKNIILQKIWNIIVSVGITIIVLGLITTIIGINIKSCNVDRYDSHLEWYRR